MKYSKFKAEASKHIIDRLKEKNPWKFDLQMQMWLMSMFGAALEIKEFFGFLERLLAEESEKFHFERKRKGNSKSLKKFLNPEAIAEFEQYSPGEGMLCYIGTDLEKEEGYINWDSIALGQTKRWWQFWKQ